MDPTTRFCPNPHCPARGQQVGHFGIHSQQDHRCICHVCHKTFSATTGTVWYRLRTSAETVVKACQSGRSGPQHTERGELLIAVLVCASLDPDGVRPSPSMKVRCQSSSISKSQRCSA